MRPPQYTPTIKELVEEFGAIPDDKNPDVAGLIIGNRVLWVNAKDVKVVEEHLSKALISADIRRRGPRPVLSPISILAKVAEAEKETPPMGEAPPMDFIHDDEIIPVGDYSRKTIIDDSVRTPEFSNDDPQYPPFLEDARGLASNHKTVEEW